LLAKVLREIVQVEDRFALEIGIGQGALVGLSLAKDQRIDLDGVDCSQSRVGSSKRVAQFNGIDANFWVSDLFASVPLDKSYDLIFFNPPYVPTNVGEELRLTERLEVDGDQVWDGGEDGTSVLREFLKQSRRFVSDHGRVVFGVQEIFVPQAKVLEVVKASPFQLIQRVIKRGIPSAVYVVAAKNPQLID
jgi:release factor glutamine methyltransferase